MLVQGPIGQFKILKSYVADSLSVFSKSMQERLLGPEDFFAAEHPQAYRGGQIICFEADAHALRKRLPPKQEAANQRRSTCLVSRSSGSAMGDNGLCNRCGPECNGVPNRRIRGSEIRIARDPPGTESSVITSRLPITNPESGQITSGFPTIRPERAITPPLRLREVGKSVGDCVPSLADP